MKASTSYQAYCLECGGGGKVLLAASKNRAQREAVRHMKMYGHQVTILYKPSFGRTA